MKGIEYGTVLQELSPWKRAVLLKGMPTHYNLFWIILQQLETQ